MGWSEAIEAIEKAEPGEAFSGATKNRALLFMRGAFNDPQHAASQTPVAVVPEPDGGLLVDFHVDGKLANSIAFFDNGDDEITVWNDGKVLSTIRLGADENGNLRIAPAPAPQPKE